MEIGDIVKGVKNWEYKFSDNFTAQVTRITDDKIQVQLLGGHIDHVEDHRLYKRTLAKFGDIFKLHPSYIEVINPTRYKKRSLKL